MKDWMDLADPTQPHSEIRNEKQPLNMAIVTGFGEKGVKELQKQLDQLIFPQQSRIIPGAPWYRAFQEPEQIIARVTRELENFDEESAKNLLLIGHSYGALIALVIACRRRLQGILKLVLIDGPLRSDVKVEPSKAAHHMFYKHYRRRENLARECEKSLRNLPKGKIFTIGTAKDRIVPPPAKLLSGNNLELTLKNSGEGNPPISVTDEFNSNIIVDIPGMAGHGLAFAKAKLYGEIIKKML